MRRRPMILGLFVLLLSGCDAGRVARLEKENADLKAQIQRSVNLDAQSKCSKDAKAWFAENWLGTDKNQISLNYTVHYNATMNKCFAFVEYRYTRQPEGSWANSLNLADVYGNATFGHYDETHNIGYDHNYTDRMLRCEMNDSTCKTMDEFNALVKPYMGN